MVRWQVVSAGLHALTLGLLCVVLLQSRAPRVAAPERAIHGRRLQEDGLANNGRQLRAITDCITEDSGVLTITCPTIIDINNAQPVAVEIRNGGGLTVTGATNLGLTNISSPDASDALTVKAGTGNAAAFTGTTTFSSQADETDAITLVQGDLTLNNANSDLTVKGSATLGVTTIKSGDSTTALTVEAGDGVAVDVSGSGSQSAVVVDSGNDAIAAIQISQGDLVIEGDNSDLSVGGTATVAGATTLSSGATITAPVLGGSALTVTGDGENPAVTIAAGSEASIALQVTEGITDVLDLSATRLFSGPVTIEGNVFIQGVVDDDNNAALTVAAGTPLPPPTQQPANGDGPPPAAQAALLVAGASSFVGTTEIKGATSIEGQTRVAGPFGVRGRVDVDGSVSIVGATSITSPEWETVALTVSQALPVPLASGFRPPPKREPANALVVEGTHFAAGNVKLGFFKSPASIFVTGTADVAGRTATSNLFVSKDGDISGNLWVHRDVYAKAYKKLPKNHRH